MKYRTSGGDRLDIICFRHYGHLKGSVEAVMKANPFLSEQPGVLPSGVYITLPVLSEPESKAIKTVSLWS